MKKSNKWGQFHRNNRGAALVTVLIVVTFISIIATTILFVSLTNRNNKVTDYKTKAEFYQTEEMLEMLKTVLIHDVSDALFDSYNEVMKKYVSYPDASTRQAAYEDAFMKAFTAKWREHFAFEDIPGIGTSYALLPGMATIFPGGSEFSERDGNEDGINDSIKFTYNDNVVIIEDISGLLPGLMTEGFSYDESLIPTYGLALSWQPADETNGFEAMLTLHDITVICVDKQGYTSVITTDIAIVPPNLNWNSTGTIVSDDLVTDCMNSVYYLNWSKE